VRGSPNNSLHDSSSSLPVVHKSSRPTCEIREIKTEDGDDLKRGMWTGTRVIVESKSAQHYA